MIELNTPGGSLDATQRIVSTLLDAPVPTIVWVTPSGARAASAGTFITLAGHIALMAPGTNIGAATPVGGGGEDIEGDLGQKVLNDAIASIRSIAETRGRDVDWAEQTVRDARSSPASEALAVGADRRDRGLDRRGHRLRRRPDGDRERAAGDARPRRCHGRGAGDEPVPGSSSISCPTRTSRSSCSRSASTGSCSSCRTRTS